MGAGGGATPPITAPQGLSGLPMPGIPQNAAMAMGAPPPAASTPPNSAMTPQQPPPSQNPSSLANAMQAMQLVKSAADDAQQSQGHSGGAGSYSPQGPKGAALPLAQIAAMIMGGGG